jgi:hypothetical protein
MPRCSLSRTRVVSKPGKDFKVTVTWTTCYDSPSPFLSSYKYATQLAKNVKHHKKVHEKIPRKKGKKRKRERVREKKGALKRLNCHPCFFTHVLLLLLALLNFLQNKGADTRVRENHGGVI